MKRESARDREKAREYNKQYRAIHTEEIHKRKKEYEAAHRKEKSEYAKKYREEHRKELRSKRNQYHVIHRKEELEAWRLKREKAKQQIIIHYGGKCQWPEGCDVTDPDILTIDHINGDGAQHRKIIGGGGSALQWWLIKNNFPPGFRLLCCNHNYKHYLNMQRGKKAET